ncbi:putative mitochondrial protein AtMg00310 [Castanea sativa]|uniref:putative mitochondrial protein AtMg00310 n=1 Tax=Castanea sativa TaxID=21020 RepID=UPI003F64BB02
MGFKDLKVLNLALLAKQGWRLSKNPTSLTHRVFKAKYFAGYSFMEAQVGRKSSYVWRSILATRETVEMGSRWCIGNGRTVEIWQNRWIPTPDNFKVISPQGLNVELVKVAQLIDGDTRMWKVDLIKKTFFPYEAEVILKIPLSPRMPEDSLI